MSSNPLSPATIADLKAKASAATPEWIHTPHWFNNGENLSEWTSCGPTHEMTNEDDGLAEIQAECDAEYIAAISPDVLLALLDRVEQAEQRERTLREALATIKAEAETGINHSCEPYRLRTVLSLANNALAPAHAPEET